MYFLIWPWPHLLKFMDSSLVWRVVSIAIGIWAILKYAVQGGLTIKLFAYTWYKKTFVYFYSVSTFNYKITSLFWNFFLSSRICRRALKIFVHVSTGNVNAQRFHKQTYSFWNDTRTLITNHFTSFFLKNDFTYMWLTL